MADDKSFLNSYHNVCHFVKRFVSLLIETVKPSTTYY